MVTEATSVNPRAGTRLGVAGASGFVGQALLQALSGHDFLTVALARRIAGQPRLPGVEWRACDLFNLRDAERALKGTEVAVYLVHSMMPSAALTQGRFEDLDLICADNFARAAASNGVRHIVYLGGLLPQLRQHLSRHLESRFEVERTLGSRGVPVTTLRAGLIIGAGGSSFDMMARLVGRLPFMLGPRWTQSLSQSIALADVVPLLKYAILHPELAGGAYDIACPDVVSYAEMLRMTGAALGKKTRVITLPVRTVKLSLLWVSAITGASQALVRPLVESLRHDMIATDGLLFQARAGIVPQPLNVALQAAVKGRVVKTALPALEPRSRAPTRRACSVQRLRLQPGRDAAFVADEYLRWLPRFLRPLLTVTVDAARTCRFFAWPLRKPLLELTFASDRSSAERQLFFVSGGVLVGDVRDARPRLEFRTVLSGAFAVAAVFDFAPRLPWFIYKFTQAVVHLFIMRAFQRHLAAGLPA